MAPAQAINALLGRRLPVVVLLVKWLTRGMAKANEDESDWIPDSSLLNEGTKRLPKLPRKQRRSGIGFRTVATGSLPRS